MCAHAQTDALASFGRALDAYLARFALEHAGAEAAVEIASRVQDMGALRTRLV